MDSPPSPSSTDTDTFSSGTSTASSSTASSSYSSDSQFLSHVGLIAQSGDCCPPPPPSPADDSEGEHPDPELDRQLAIAIAHIYTPTPIRSSTSSSQSSTNQSGQSDYCNSSGQSQSKRTICNHSLIARIYTEEARCYHCKKAHFFGWVYRCRGCGYRVCHNCRPRFVERSWDSIGGLIRVDVPEGVAGVDGGPWPGWGTVGAGL